VWYMSSIVLYTSNVHKFCRHPLSPLGWTYCSMFVFVLSNGLLETNVLAVMFVQLCIDDFEYVYLT
jgi:hypothetical protein